MIGDGFLKGNVMHKYLVVILTLLFSVQKLPAPDTRVLWGDSKNLTLNPINPIDPSKLLIPINIRASVLEGARAGINQNSDINTLNKQMRFVMNEAYNIHAEYSKVLQNRLNETDRNSITDLSNKYYDMYQKILNMTYKGTEKFEYLREDMNYIFLRSQNTEYRIKKSTIRNLKDLQDPKIAGALKYFTDNNIIGVKANLICHPGAPGHECFKFNQSIDGKNTIDMAGFFSIVYDPNAITIGNFYIQNQAKAPSKAPTPPPPPLPSDLKQTWFEGEISEFSQVSDGINLAIKNPRVTKQGAKFTAPDTMRFKMPISALRNTVYIPNPDPSKPRIESNLGELITAAGNTLIGRPMKIFCQLGGCTYDSATRLVSGSLYFSDLPGDDIRKIIVDKRAAQGAQFTTASYKFLNAGGSYIRFNDSSGAVIATKKRTITNLASLQPSESIISYSLKDPSKYPIRMSLTCEPNNSCSKTEVKNSAGTIIGTEIVGNTTLTLNPEDVAKIQSDMTRTQEAKADINAAPKAVYKTFSEFRDALYKARFNPQAMEGIFTQVLDDMNQGRISSFVGQNGMFDLSNMDLTVIPRLLPEVFSKSSAQGLSLARNNLSSIQGLEKIPGGRLRGINLNDNPKLVSLAPIAGQPLEFLIAFNTSVSRDMNGLDALYRGPSSQTLKELSLDNTGLSVITFLTNFRKLSKVAVRYNPATTNLDPKSVDTLTTLQSRGVQVIAK